MVEGKVVIELVDSSGKGGSSGSGSSFKPTGIQSPKDLINSKINNILHPISTLEHQLASEGEQFGSYVMGQITSMVGNVAVTEMNRYFSLKEDYISQNRVKNLMQAKNVVTGIANNVQQGAMAGFIGSGGNPMIAAVGAIVGAVSSTAQMAIQRDKQIEDYMMQLNAVNIQTSFASSRASLVNGGHGTEN